MYILPLKMFQVIGWILRKRSIPLLKLKIECAIQVNVLENKIHETLENVNDVTFPHNCATHSGNNTLSFVLVKFIRNLIFPDLAILKRLLTNIKMRGL